MLLAHLTTEENYLLLGFIIGASIARSSLGLSLSDSPFTSTCCGLLPR